MGKILRISLKINFTPSNLGYGLTCKVFRRGLFVRRTSSWPTRTGGCSTSRGSPVRPGWRWWRTTGRRCGRAWTWWPSRRRAAWGPPSPAPAGPRRGWASGPPTTTPTTTRPTASWTARGRWCAAAASRPRRPHGSPSSCQSTPRSAPTPGLSLRPSGRSGRTL